MNINSIRICTYFGKKASDFRITKMRSISDAAHFYVSRDRFKIICRHAYASSIKIHMYVQTSEVETLAKKSRNFR